MSLLTHHAGVWKEGEASVTDGGIIKPWDTAWVTDGGVWKEFYSSGPPEIGEPWEGGFYLGEFNGYYLVIADKSSEAQLQWKTTNTASNEASSLTDGWVNTNAINNATHPAAQYCRAYMGGGFEDWYLAARDELNLFWLNISPGNANSPAIFRVGGAQALRDSTIVRYWSSTNGTATGAWNQIVVDGRQYSGNAKTSNFYLRPIRRIPI